MSNVIRETVAALSGPATPATTAALAHDPDRALAERAAWERFAAAAMGALKDSVFYGPSDDGTESIYVRNHVDMARSAAAVADSLLDAWRARFGGRP